METGKILIFHLSRFGYADYAAGMINHLPLHDCLIFLSKYHSVPVKKPFETVRTYRNRWEFAWASLINLPLFCWKIFRQAQKNNLKAALFMGFHYWDLPLIWICRKTGLRIIYTVHDGILHEGENYWHHRWLQNTCILKADNLIFLSHFMERETKKRLHFSAPSQVIPHGLIEVPGLKNERRFLPPLRLLFLGRLGRYKGLEQLCEAIRLAEDQDLDRLTIAGQPLYRLDLPGHPKIKRIEKWLSESEIADLLNSHDALVLPYQNATQSGVVTLGITAAIPMICTPVGGLPEQLAENEAVWVKTDAAGILEGIRKLNENPMLCYVLHERMKEKRRKGAWVSLAGQLADVVLKPVD